MNFRVLVFFILSTFLLASCGSKKRVVTTKKEQKKRQVYQEQPKNSKNEPYEDTPAEIQDDVTKTIKEKTYKDKSSKYVADFAEIAMEEMRIYGIPASITLAQGILESGAGEGELTRKANNHFGIKCHGWKGGKVYHDDDKAQECFRKYYDAKYSFRDHSLFLTERKRYMGLFKLSKDDYKGWAKGLKEAGYATDPRYPNKLISLVERYKLYEYDAQVLGKTGKDVKKVTENNNRYTVEKGDTLYRIAKKHNITVEQLKDFNGLTSNDISIGQVLYVKPLPKDF